MFSWGSMYTLDENHHGGDLNVHRQGLDMIRSGAVKSSKNKDPNRSSIQRPFVMHHLCHIFASKRLPSKLYPPSTKPIQVHCFPNQTFTYPLTLEGWTPPKNVHQNIPPQKNKCWSNVVYPTWIPIPERLLSRCPTTIGFASSNLPVFFLHLHPYAIQSNPTQRTQPSQLQTTQPNQPNCKQPIQPNSNLTPTNSNPNQLPTTNFPNSPPAPKAKGGVVEETPESGTLGTPKSPTLNRFTESLNIFSCK